MAVPVSQMWTVASYVLRQKLAGRERYPLVLMLEPLFRCNLACAGLRQDSVSGAHFEDRPFGGRLHEGGRRVRSADGVDSGRRAADASADRQIVEGLVARKNISISAPTRCC